MLKDQRTSADSAGLRRIGRRWVTCTRRVHQTSSQATVPAGSPRSVACSSPRVTAHRRVGYNHGLHGIGGDRHMSLPKLQPTPYAEVNAAVHQLFASLQAVLCEQLVGLYLGGSLALGDFNPRRSDIDFVAVTVDHLRRTCWSRWSRCIRACGPPDQPGPQTGRQLCSPAGGPPLDAGSSTLPLY